MRRTLSSRARSALEAGRLLRELKIDERLQVPIFRLVRDLGLELVFRPLDRLFGAYIPSSEDTLGGVLISANLPRAVQRFTSAHELGHHVLNHDGVVDTGQQVDNPSSPRERDADAFAERLLMPEVLVQQSTKRLGLSSGLRSFDDAYQLSLEIGVSYIATVKRLLTLGYITPAVANEWSRREPREAKARIAPAELLENYRRDALILSPYDERTDVYVRDGDVVAVEVEEAPTTGYVWQVTSTGPTKLLAEIAPKDMSRYGASVKRRVVFMVDGAGEGSLMMELKRPWLPESAIRLHTVDVHGEPVPLGPVFAEV